MSDRYSSILTNVSNNATVISQHQPIQYYHQYSDHSNKTFLTNDELDYLENVINKNYPIVPSKGFLSFNDNANNNCDVSNVANFIPSSEPSFKGQLSKYFPESIRSNFNESVDFNELKASELFVSDNSFHDVAWDEFYEDSNSTDMNSNDVLNSNSSSNSNMGLTTNQIVYARFNSTSNESLDFNNRIIKNEEKKLASECRNVGNNNCINKISMVNNRHRGIIKKEPKVKKIICMKDCLHVWEFLRDLLRDSRYNNKIIKWLDQKQGVFKILDPNSVSLLWGKKKLKKSDMKYPNMARGIRYSREEGGYFDSVSKNLGYGKKLVYKFSKKTLDHCEWLRSFITEF